MCQDNSGVPRSVCKKPPHGRLETVQNTRASISLCPKKKLHEAYKMKIMSVVGKGIKPQVRAVEPGDVAGRLRNREPRETDAQ